MDRRTFNKIFASTLMASPLALQASSETQRIKLKKNVVIISNDYGFKPNMFFPKGRELDSPYMDLYGDVRKKMTVFKGIEQKEMGGGHRSHHSIFTAQSKYGKTVKPFVSLDQFISSRVVQESRHKFLNLCTGKTAQTSWSLSGQAVPFLGKAEQSFSKVFKEKISTQQLIEEQSYLKTFSSKFSQGSNHKLYQKSMNELQSELTERIEWSKETLPKVDYKFKAEKNEFMNIAINLDIIKMALVKKQCRIFNFNVSNTGTVDIEGISEGYHSLTHAGKDPAKVEKLIEIEKFIIGEYSRFLNELDKHGILDETLIILTGAFGNSNSHSTKDLPCILVGGGLDHAGVVNCKDKSGKQIHPLSDLYVTFMQAAGLKDVNTFAGYTGNMNKYFG